MSPQYNHLYDLPPHCEPSTPVLAALSSFLRTCIPSYLYLASNVLGMLSITAWLFAQLPQIIKNQQIKSVDGLSPIFLGNWLLGDATNLIGAVLTHQMWFQQVIGVYYVLVDLCLCLQYWVFSRKKDRWDKYSTMALYDDSEDEEGLEVVEGVSPSQLSGSPIKPVNVEGKKIWDIKTFGSHFGSVSTLAVSPRSVAASSVIMGAKLADALPVNKVPAEVVSVTTALVLDSEFYGNVSAWVSASLYLSSRIPQLYKNYTRRSCAGLSIYLFVAAFFGNLFYSTSLLLNPLGMSDFPPYGGGGIVGPEGSLKARWWKDALPFFIGSAGVLAMDAAMGLQFLMWGEQKPIDELWEEETEDPEPIDERSRLLG